MLEQDTRDQQIARLIRDQIAKIEADRRRLSYRVGSPEDAVIMGRITGLRDALAFVDPDPWH